jgi:hypothetical protein
MTPPERRPFPFIVGQHRSGTTLLRLMLDAHPQLAIPPETQFIPLVAQRCAAAADPRRSFLDTLTGHPHWPDVHVDDAVLDERLQALEPFDVGDALRAFYALYAERFGKPRFGDKTPRYVLHMELIERLLPEACFIHIIRDGRDVTLSVMDEQRRAGKTVRAAHVARRWREKIALARSQAHRLNAYAEIRYEDLVLDTEAALRRVCDAIDLKWDPAMLEYHATAPARLAELVSVDAKWATVGERRARHAWAAHPPEPTRVGRWRREMSPADRRSFEEEAGDLLRELGYEPGARVER